MLDLTTVYLLIIYTLFLLAFGFAIGTQYERILRWLQEKGKTMPSNPKEPRGLGNKARERLTDVQMHVGDADRKLEKLASSNLDASNARVSLWQALAGIAGLFGMGRDPEENGNGNGHES